MNKRIISLFFLIQFAAGAELHYVPASLRAATYKPRQKKNPKPCPPFPKPPISPMPELPEPPQIIFYSEIPPPNLPSFLSTVLVVAPPPSKQRSWWHRTV